ncbi:tyrosine-protein phosphatase [Hoeflea sp. WL0058]|uniref:Tyrosine-protein phosphatase n=1 Tax=Flavimaribacter sediminis TaxID=2865987 RepID=A0AAE2ZQF1_9HYPH|nr:tyrosine-protein phosphatase [Flavimaribacter sediminis]MBW8638865.1 tyrosine-protein phosphatase [Flavimaribacter sediminis]
MNTVSRVITVDGAMNLRDLGGLSTTDGGSVRRNKLYRSARLSTVTDRGRDQLKDLGIAVVCDLRGTKESALDPSELDGVVGRFHPLPIEPTLKAHMGALFGTSFQEGISARDVMVDIYRSFGAKRINAFIDLVGLLTADETPLLFHCTAGKDRTGFGAAIILRLLGVPMDDILHDYMLTNEHWTGTGKLDHLPDEVRLAIERVERDYLEAAFDSVDATYGSFDAYADKVLGLDHQAIDRLRELYVE